MFVQLDKNKYMVGGTLCHITFKPAGYNKGKASQYLQVEEGRYKNGKFERLRTLNGDETDLGGPGFGARPVVLEITLVTR